MRSDDPRFAKIREQLELLDKAFPTQDTQAALDALKSLEHDLADNKS